MTERPTQAAGLRIVDAVFARERAHVSWRFAAAPLAALLVHGMALAWAVANGGKHREPAVGPEQVVELTPPPPPPPPPQAPPPPVAPSVAAPAALANSSGIFLGRDYTYDLVRPGAALYGIAPVSGEVNPMRPVVRLDGRILQVREIDLGVPVGYGATYGARRRERIATVGVGYADGYLRSLSNRSSGYIGAHRVPLVGRVSMDLITFDVTDVPDVLTRPGASIELIGPQRTVDAVAQDAQTIGYEILTSLGSRYARAYLPVAD